MAWKRMKPQDVQARTKAGTPPVWYRLARQCLRLHVRQKVLKGTQTGPTLGAADRTVPANARLEQCLGERVGIDLTVPSVPPLRHAWSL